MKNKVEIEATITVKRNDCVATDNAFAYDENASLQRIKIGSDVTVHKIITKKGREELIRRYSRMGLSCQRIGDNALWVSSPSCASCKFLSLENVSILGSKSTEPDRVSYRILVPSISKLKAIERDAKKLGMEPVVSEIYESSRMLLTDREREVLIALYRAGFFDPVRSKNLTQLARDLDISPASLSEILRRTLKKIITEYIDKME